MARGHRTLLAVLIAALCVASIAVSIPAKAAFDRHPCSRYNANFNYTLTCQSRTSAGSLSTMTKTVDKDYLDSVTIGYARITTFSRTANLFGGYFTGYDYNRHYHYRRFFVCRADQSYGPYCKWA